MGNGQLLIPAIALFIIVVWEIKAPLLDKTESLPRLASNLALGAFSFYVARYAITFLAIYFPLQFTENDTPLLSSTFAISLVAGILALDLLNYWVHRIFHTVSWLWRFHKVHHSDPVLDFSTYKRHHPFESLAVVIITLPFFVLTQMDLRILVVYFVLNEIISLFAHANLKLPTNLESALSRFVVTPGFHRQHHSRERRRTDSHYGQVFTFWDRLFCTYIPYNPNSTHKVQVGLNEYPQERQTLLDKALLMPFSTHNPDQKVK